MIEYKNISEKLQEELKQIAETDEFGTLNPETIYTGIRRSTGTNEKLAEFYDVPVDLVQKIKELNKETKD